MAPEPATHALGSKLFVPAHFLPASVASSSHKAAFTAEQQPAPSRKLVLIPGCLLSLLAWPIGDGLFRRMLVLSL